MRAYLATLALLTSTVLAPRAWSAPPHAHDDAKAAARALAERGYALYDAGKYQEAIEMLTQADQTYHAPTLVFAVARAHAALGELVEARAALQRVIDEPLTAASPQPFREAQRTAKVELAAIEKRIPTLLIVVRGGDGRDLRATLDEVPINPWGPDRPVMANPGTHRVRVAPPGEEGASRTVDLAEGATVRVDLDLSAPSDTIGGAEPSKHGLAPALVGFGVGIAGLGLGIGLGVAALNTASDLQNKCRGFVVGSLGVATGVVWVVVRKTTSPKQAGVAIGPGWVGMKGVF